MNDLVSIITPTYNCARFLPITINSVLAQTHQNWELLIVDDCSADNTREVVAAFGDPRIKYFRNEKNLGAALSRNKALREAKGRWIAFLDSDDLWMPEKLAHQIAFMEKNGYHFSCHKRTVCEEDGTPTDIVISSPAVITKFKMHNYCWCGATTVMYDADVMGVIQIEDLKKRNDYAIWLKAIEKANCYYLDELLSVHRRRKGSVSNAKKSVLVKHFYLLYRKGEHMSVPRSLWRTARNLVCGAFKGSLYRRRDKSLKTGCLSGEYHG